MSLRELKPEDIEVFSAAVLRYFESTTGQKAEVRSAYLVDSGEPLLENDYNGVITVSGGYVGSICFSAPRDLLTHVLLAVGERNYSDAHHRDLVGEIANTLSGQARRHFGAGLEISTPAAFRAGHRRVEKQARSTPYAVPLTWHGYHADLVVNLDAGR